MYLSYGPSFFPFAYGSSAKRAGHKLTGKRGSVTYHTDRENEVSKIFIISLRYLLYHLATQASSQACHSN